jgi:hypothetical protein
VVNEFERHVCHNSVAEILHDLQAGLFSNRCVNWKTFLTFLSVLVNLAFEGEVAQRTSRSRTCDTNIGEV